MKRSGAPRPSIEDRIAASLRESSDTLRFLMKESPAIARAAGLLVLALRKGKKLLAFGNGGSAADAQHLTAELSGRFEKDRRGLPAVALTTNPSAVTALANDYF